MKYQNVLFDLDGTLADSEPLKAKALSLAVREFSGQAPAETYKKVMGQSWEAVTNAFFAHAGIQVPLEQFDPVFREFYLELIENELFDARAAQPFISRLNDEDVKVGVVSSAAPWMVQKILQKLNLQEFFDVVVTGHDVQNHKPDPEAYLIALKKFAVTSSEVIAFEDSESGFRAAQASGIQVFGIKHDYNENHDFSLCSDVFGSFSDCWREAKPV